MYRVQLIHVRTRYIWKCSVLPCNDGTSIAPGWEGDFAKVVDMNWAVVMAGGRGVRFWPESRNRRPKPYLPLIGNETPLQETVARLQPYFPPSRILLVVQKELVKETKRQLPKIPMKNILGEPVGRNTAPCCVWAAAEIARRDRQAKFIFLPADQRITQKSPFLKTVRTAMELAEDRPVLFGIRPTWPNPAYGYLGVTNRKRLKNGLTLGTVSRFREKPSKEKAREFLRRGNFFWNGGTFAWRLDTFNSALKKHAPVLHRAFDSLSHASKSSLALIYRRLPSISIDYAVMEKMKNALCLLAPFRLDDLGGWLSLSEFWPKDSHGNRFRGKAFFVNARGNIVKASERLVAIMGVEDLLIIDTLDALLICPRWQSEKIRDVVRELERRRMKKYL